jgi:hypothetical protein
MALHPVAPKSRARREGRSVFTSQLARLAEAFLSCERRAIL